MSLPPPLPDAPLSTPASAPAPAHRGWWQRHWKWAVPTLVVCGFALFAAALFGLFSLTTRMMRDNDAYRIALGTAQADRRLVADLGRPIEPRWWITGNVNAGADGSGSATLLIPVEGPRGGATVYADASAEHGDWKFTYLVAILDGSGDQIDLMGSLPPGRRARTEAPATGGADECPTRPH